MWFQRLVEFDDDSEPEPILRSTELPEKPQVPVSTPVDFQRVRLMSILRLKEQKAKDAQIKTYDELSAELLAYDELLENYYILKAVEDEENDSTTSEKPSITKRFTRLISTEDAIRSDSSINSQPATSGQITPKQETEPTAITTGRPSPPTRKPSSTNKAVKGSAKPSTAPSKDNIEQRTNRRFGL
jgi:hypothetical protein